MAPLVDAPTNARFRPGGFTLIEILLVVAMLSIAAVVLIPNLAHVADFGTEAGVRRVVADLTFAQSDAMARQQKRRVLFADDQSGYRLLADPFDPVNDVLYDPISFDGSGLYIVDFANDPNFQTISVESADFDSGNAFITYDELGGPIAPDNTPSNGGSAIISGNGERFRISVAPFTGRITVDELP